MVFVEASVSIFKHPEAANPLSKDELPLPVYAIAKVFPLKLVVMPLTPEKIRVSSHPEA